MIGRTVNGYHQEKIRFIYQVFKEEYYIFARFTNFIKKIAIYKLE